MYCFAILELSEVQIFIEIEELPMKKVKIIGWSNCFCFIDIILAIQFQDACVKLNHFFFPIFLVKLHQL